MTTDDVFGSSYAMAYDAVYREKDYAAEVDRVLTLARAAATMEPTSILDLGCGTGGHAVPLTQRGLRVVGVDRSSDMLEVAREKLARLSGADAEVVEGDVRDVRLDDRFDAVIIMFAVLGYQLEDDDVLRTLRTAAAHLDPGGALVFDVWFGPAVLHVGPEERRRTVEVEGRQLERTSSATVDLLSQVATVEIGLLDVAGGSSTRETHRMRFFFPRELHLLLGSAGFELVGIEDFERPGAPPDASTWNVVVAARRVAARG